METAAASITPGFVKGDVGDLLVLSSCIDGRKWRQCERTGRSSCKLARGGVSRRCVKRTQRQRAKARPRGGERCVTARFQRCACRLDPRPAERLKDAECSTVSELARWQYAMRRADQKAMRTTYSTPDASSTYLSPPSIPSNHTGPHAAKTRLPAVLKTTFVFPPDAHLRARRGPVGRRHDWCAHCRPPPRAVSSGRMRTPTCLTLVFLE